MKYANIKKYDVSNGVGVRVSLFVSGCRHHCKGCFNAEAWDFNYGTEFTQETIDQIIELLKPDYIQGLSLLGGEPLAPENQEQVWNLIQQVRAKLPKKDIRCYSGFTYEFIQEYMVPHLPYTEQIFDNIDVLVDGKWKEELKNLNLRFRGSANQRVIDVPSTRKYHTIMRALQKEKEKLVQLPLFSKSNLSSLEKVEQKIVEVLEVVA
jgi:anaerobic ribonucleoside-triphosphate reductase activating protein